MASDAFAQQLRRHALEVQELEGAQAKEFLRLLRQLQDELRGKLAALPREVTLDAVKLRQVQLETEASIRTMTLRADRNFRGSQDSAVDLATDHLTDEIASLSKAFEGHGLHVNLDVARVLADPHQGLLAENFAASMQTYGSELLNQVRARLFMGMRAGESFGQVVSSVADLGTIGSKAERLVRTETSNAYGVAQHASIRQAAKTVPGLKKTWLHVGSYLCKICGPLHGTTRPLDGTWTIKSGKHTRKVAHAPAHPNCTCRVVAMKASWHAGMEKLGYLQDQKTSDAPGRASL